jgi:hypothetical protein
VLDLLQETSQSNLDFVSSVVLIVTLVTIKSKDLEPIPIISVGFLTALILFFLTDLPIAVLYTTSFSSIFTEAKLGTVSIHEFNGLLILAAILGLGIYLVDVKYEISRLDANLLAISIFGLVTVGGVLLNNFLFEIDYTLFTSMPGIILLLGLGVLVLYTQYNNQGD